MRLCSPWQRCGLPGAGPIKGFCSGWRAHCRKIVPRKISMVHWRKRNARQMTAAGPRRGPESGVVQAPAPGHPSLLGTPCSGPAVGPRVASGPAGPRATGTRGGCRCVWGWWLASPQRRGIHPGARFGGLWCSRAPGAESGSEGQLAWKGVWLGSGEGKRDRKGAPEGYAVN